MGINPIIAARRQSAFAHRKFCGPKNPYQQLALGGHSVYLRTGKRMRARSSEIAVVFKETPHSIFGPDAGSHRNALVIRLQPDEGITLDVTIKEPGPGDAFGGCAP